MHCTWIGRRCCIARKTLVSHSVGFCLERESWKNRKEKKKNVTAVGILRDGGSGKGFLTLFGTISQMAFIFKGHFF